MGLKISAGPNCRATTRPTAMASFAVSSVSTSQDMAVRNIHVPVLAIVVPTNQSR